MALGFHPKSYADGAAASKAAGSPAMALPTTPRRPWPRVSKRFPTSLGLSKDEETTQDVWQVMRVNLRLMVFSAYAVFATFSDMVPFPVVSNWCAGKRSWCQAGRTWHSRVRGCQGAIGSGEFFRRSSFWWHDGKRSWTMLMTLMTVDGICQVPYFQLQGGTESEPTEQFRIPGLVHQVTWKSALGSGRSCVARPWSLRGWWKGQKLTCFDWCLVILV